MALYCIAMHGFWAAALGYLGCTPTDLWCCFCMWVATRWAPRSEGMLSKPHMCTIFTLLAAAWEWYFLMVRATQGTSPAVQHGAVSTFAGIVPSLRFLGVVDPGMTHALTPPFPPRPVQTTPNEAEVRAARYLAKGVQGKLKSNVLGHLHSGDVYRPH